MKATPSGDADAASAGADEDTDTDDDRQAVAPRKSVTSIAPAVKKNPFLRGAVNFQIIVHVLEARDLSGKCFGVEVFSRAQRLERHERPCCSN